MYRVVIPSRYGASRLPGKPLIVLAGKPMIQWVYERARSSAAGEVIIATDDERIASVARAVGADVAMTAATHASGTDRIAEVARARQWAATDIVVNVQGDEPLIPPALIDQVATLLATFPNAQMATLVAPLTDARAFADPNAVKVVVDSKQRALYFSRAPIPCDRDAALVSASATSRALTTGVARRHVGIYAYRVSALLGLASLPASPLERLEKLEQLRALENGFDIRVAECAVAPGPDVNTREDLAQVESLLAAGP
jgi:3-deoxy-manno-octulosonate cytidylyltransferase (CMP-KDO synthetase)